MLAENLIKLLILDLMECALQAKALLHDVQSSCNVAIQLQLVDKSASLINSLSLLLDEADTLRKIWLNTDKMKRKVAENEYNFIPFSDSDVKLEFDTRSSKVEVGKLTFPFLNCLPQDHSYELKNQLQSSLKRKYSDSESEYGSDFITAKGQPENVNNYASLPNDIQSLSPKKFTPTTSNKTIVNKEHSIQQMKFLKTEKVEACKDKYNYAQLNCMLKVDSISNSATITQPLASRSHQTTTERRSIKNLQDQQGLF